MKKQSIRNKWHKIRSVYIWHRYLGLLASLVMILVAMTGILLNHTDLLQLNKKYVRNDVLLDSYQISGNNLPVRVFNSCLKPVIRVGDQLFQGKARRYAGTPVIAALQWQSYCLLATSKALVFMEDDFLADRIEYPLLLTRLVQDSKNREVQLGTDALQQIFLKIDAAVYVLDNDWTDFIPYRGDTSKIFWSRTSVAATSRQEKMYRQLYRQHIITWETLIKDLHSGRLFKKWGIWFYDIVAVMMILLSLSGLYLFSRQLIKKIQRRQGKRAHQRF